MSASLINLEPIVVPQDFLYLSGILEPDSALVLHGKGRPDQAILFVPRRDPGRELWDGPRSGKDGAAALTGIERVHSTEELGLVLKTLKGGWTGVRTLVRVIFVIEQDVLLLHLTSFHPSIFVTIVTPVKLCV